MRIDLDFRFQNRSDAATQMVNEFFEDIGYSKNILLFALSLNSIALTDLISLKLNLVIDLFLNSSVSAPNNAECPIAVISENRDVVVHEELKESFEISTDYINDKTEKAYEEEILKRADKFRDGEKMVSMQSRDVILIDDSSDNALVALTAIKCAIRMGAKTITYMCAVIPKEIEEYFRDNIDRVFYLHSVKHYINNQHYYIEKMKDLSDEDVSPILKNSENFIVNRVKEKNL